LDSISSSIRASAILATSLAKASIAIKSRAICITIDDLIIVSPDTTAITAAIWSAGGSREGRTGGIARVCDARDGKHTIRANGRRSLSNRSSSRCRRARGEAELEAVNGNKVATSGRHIALRVGNTATGRAILNGKGSGADSK